jgi:hypothetical protein
MVGASPPVSNAATPAHRAALAEQVIACAVALGGTAPGSWQQA